MKFVKPTLLFHKFNLPVFKANIWVFVGKTVREGIDYAEDKTSETIVLESEKKYIRAYTYAYETEEGRRKYMLFFKYNAKPGEIAHEVKHLINILFSWHGYKLSLSNDEMECYYLENIIDKAHRIINKYNKSLKRAKVNAILS
jgi:hypothetical protein